MGKEQCPECGSKNQRWYTVLARVCAECWYYEDGGLGEAWYKLPDGPVFYAWEEKHWRTTCDLFLSPFAVVIDSTQEK